VATVSLSPGTRLGPYEIVSLIGAGGMGEVYRARDPRLGRDVALKILRRSPTDPEQIARFSREAQAAGTLNHPNIVAVFDVGTEAGVPYVVTELLVGETLRERLNRGPVPYRKAVDYGIQIAQALDAAHARGIWHRDVKPANVFVTENGTVKLLDFGIAKLNEPSVSSDEPTVEDTETGQIRGTAGYMSPEQVRGQAVDHRSDIFAIGAVLFEMFTGQRAFRRSSNLETMHAVLHEDPPDPLGINPNLPPVAAAVIRRCLEKNKEERIQSARDLSFDLQQLREITAGSRVFSRSRLPMVRRWMPAALAALVLVAAGAAAVLLFWPNPAPTFDQVTFRRGRIGGARFTSDGRAVVYSEALRGNDLEVRRLDLGESPSPRALEYARGTDVLAVRAGEVALALSRRFVGGELFVGTLGIAQSGGGAPRTQAENVIDADWDQTTGRMAMARSPGDGSVLEYPVGTVLYRTQGSIRFVRVSPNGQYVAFLEDSSARGIGGTVCVVDLSGVMTKLTDSWTSVRGLAWSPSGREVWFTASLTRSKRALRAVTLSGRHRQRVVYEAPSSLTIWDIAGNGNVLLSHDDERRTVIAQAPGDSVERDVSWFDDAGVADISDDGRLILFRDRFGIYLGETNGSAPTHLWKEGFADDLSSDNQTVLATIGNSLALVPRNAGDPKPLPAFGIVTYRGARFFPDGRRVVFAGVEKGMPGRSYVQNLDGKTAPRAITPELIRVLAVSPKGDQVAATADDQPVTIWPVDGGKPIVVKGSEPKDRPITWSADGRSLWVFRRSEVPGHLIKLDLATGQRLVTKLLEPPDSAGVYSIIEVQITPSGHAYAYTYPRLLSQLYVAKGLR
jgi:Tol biopolymer transport system component/tRNA A-37 threonylcarbamoyl transferase component Bud32